MFLGSGRSDPFVPTWLEVRRLDRLLAQVTRPSLSGSGLSASMRDQLRDAGLTVGRRPRRDALVTELWVRKRPLLRGLDGFDDLMPPCA